MYRINFKCEIEILTYKDKGILNNINPDCSTLPDKELTLDSRKVYDIIGTFEALDEFKNPTQPNNHTPSKIIRAAEAL